MSAPAGVSSHHLNGGDLVEQVGTAYFGCREPDGRFSLARLKGTVARVPQIRAIEVNQCSDATRITAVPSLTYCEDVCRPMNG